MKPIYVHFGGALALSFTIAACVPAPDSTPEPQPSPTQVPVTVVPADATTPAPPAAKNWIDNPRTPGTWRLSDSQAAYVERDAQGTVAPSAPLFLIECRRPNVRLMTRIAAPRASTMTIRTETTARSLQLTPSGAEAQPIYGFVDLPARDPLLDAMAITRGRFAVETSGLSTLYLPPWAEVTRAIEDCR